MNLIKKYKDNLKVKLTDDTSTYKSGVVILNVDSYVISGVTRIEFEKLYPNLLVSMYDEGIINHLKISKDIIGKIKLYIDGDASLREYSNSIWIKELRAVTPILFDAFYQYMIQYYTDIIKVNKNLIYIDTDMMFFEGIPDLLDINIPYITKNIDHIIFKGLKRYGFVIDNEISLRGFHPYIRQTGYKLDSHQNEIRSSLETIIRDKKLESILS